jgi:hypothetical protein
MAFLHADLSIWGQVYTILPSESPGFCVTRLKESGVRRKASYQELLNRIQSGARARNRAEKPSAKKMKSGAFEAPFFGTITEPDPLLASRLLF